jgi:hypothetical protein
MTSASLAARIRDLAATFRGIDAADLDESALAALREFRRLTGWKLGLHREAVAFKQSAADLPDPVSRRQAEQQWRQWLMPRPWRGKVQQRPDGSWTVTGKSYTVHGTVMVYAASPRAAGLLVEAIENGLAPLRTEDGAVAPHLLAEQPNQEES